MKKTRQQEKTANKTDARPADRYMVSSQRGKSRAKVRYVETNKPKSCKLL